MAVLGLMGIRFYRGDSFFGGGLLDCVGGDIVCTGCLMLWLIEEGQGRSAVGNVEVFVIE